jgi:broad specificity phosphatase PhoE
MHHCAAAACSSCCRASLAWQDILSEKDDAPEKAVMVVAHNAVNQALIGSALGLPPRYFRRLLQVRLHQLQLRRVMLCSCKE